jgi:hypothetical protein
VLPVPGIAIFPGIIVKVHEPDAGNPSSTTLPVDSSVVGWVIAPIRGACGVGGCTGIITFADIAEIHPVEVVTV